MTYLVLTYQYPFHWSSYQECVIANPAQNKWSKKRLRNKISGKEKEKVSSVKKAMATWNFLVPIYSTFTLKSPLFPFI